MLIPTLRMTNLARRYNCLVDDHAQPDVPLHHLDALAQLFLRYNVDSIFGVHLVHGHLRIHSDTVMLGSMFRDDSSVYWTRPSFYKDVLAKDVHGHIYKVTADNHLLAYEYREGTPPDNVATIDPAFFHEFIKYLLSHKLEGILGLQILEYGLDTQSQMREFVFAEQGTVMLREEDATNAYISRVTGWSGERSADGTVSMKGIETHASKPGGPHQRFSDGKLLKDIDALRSLLKDGIIKDKWNLTR